MKSEKNPRRPAVAGFPAGDTILRAKTGGVDNRALWMTRSSCCHTICLLACGRERWRGDRQGLCPPNQSPASTLVPQVFQEKAGSCRQWGAARTGNQEAGFWALLCCVTWAHS